MREMLNCEKHGVRWLLGDTPCEQCRRDNDADNKRAIRLATHGKPIWPKSKAEKQNA